MTSWTCKARAPFNTSLVLRPTAGAGWADRRQQHRLPAEAAFKLEVQALPGVAHRGCPPPWQVCGSLGCGAGVDTIQRLPKTRAALAESLRLYPQPPILIRRALGPDTLPAPLHGDPNGYPIDKGADLFISVWNLHRWGLALQPDTPTPADSAFARFGTGVPRVCVRPSQGGLALMPRHLCLTWGLLACAHGGVAMCSLLSALCVQWPVWGLRCLLSLATHTSWRFSGHHTCGRTQTAFIPSASWKRTATPNLEVGPVPSELFSCRAPPLFVDHLEGRTSVVWLQPRS